ncbi:MAG: FIST N-terminal domain-containing protein [Dehalococcoidia bacterium]
MKWASAISERPDLASALDECANAILPQLADASQADGPSPQPAGADLVFVFASPHYDVPGQSLAALAGEYFPGAVVAGCMGVGIIGAGHEVEHRAALSMTAARLPDVTVTGFHVRNRDLPSPDDPPDRWAELLGVPLDSGPQFIVLTDPYTIDGEALLNGLDFAFPAAAKIGGLASGGRRNHALYLHNDVFHEGAVGIALSGNIIVDTVVAQGCRPIGHPMRVTKVEHNLVLALDGETPLETLQRLFESLSERDQELAKRNLFMGVAMDPLLEDAGQGDFLVRNVMGIDPQRGAVAVGALLREGQTVQFHVRDAQTSSDDLRLSLSSYASRATRDAMGALLFSCTGRGRYLYGEPDHDTSIFHELIGDLPLGGFFCNGEIGPVSGVTYLHGYTSSFGIFRPRTGS